jgi:hypothetical protein
MLAQDAVVALIDATYDAVKRAGYELLGTVLFPKRHVRAAAYVLGGAVCARARVTVML